MFKLLITSLAIALFSVSNGYSMDCSTPRHEIEFKLGADAITFYEDQSSPERSVASDVDAAVFKQGKSLTQYFEYEGLSHLIHVQNMNNPNSSEDYILLENDEGERMLYPLECKA